MVGFFLLCLLVAGSLYAIIGFPYATIGREWRSGTLTGRPEVPQLAQPSWVNWLREDKLHGIGQGLGAGSHHLFPMLGQSQGLLGGKIGRAHV